MRFLLITVFAGAALAQVPQLEGVTTGLLFDPPTRSLRTLRGILGAAYMGPEAIGDIDAAFVSSDGTVAVSKRGDRLQIRPLNRSREGSERELASTEDIAEGCRSGWSTDSTTLVLACPLASGTRVHVLQTKEPFATWYSDIAGSAVFAGIAAGNRVVIGANGETPGAYYLSADGAMRPVATFRNIAAGYLDPRTDTVYLAESEAGTLFKIDLQGGGQTTAAWQLPAEWLGSIAGVAANGTRVAIAERHTPAVHVIDITRSMEIATAFLDLPPQRVSGAGAPGLWVLNSRVDEHGSALVFDFASSAAFFVPVGDAR